VSQDIADGLERMASLKQPRRQRMSKQVESAPTRPSVEAGVPKGAAHDGRKIIRRDKGLEGSHVSNEHLAP
jgi:hypothetical protein